MKTVLCPGGRKISVSSNALAAAYAGAMAHAYATIGGKMMPGDFPWHFHRFMGHRASTKCRVSPSENCQKAADRLPRAMTLRQLLENSPKLMLAERWEA